MTLRTVLFHLLLGLLAVFSGTAEGQDRPAPVTSPEVAESRTITFRLRAPEAKSVRLGKGDLPGYGGVGPGPEMTRDSDGVWEITTHPVPPGAYRYNFLLDGVTVIDPRNPSTSESNENTWSLVYVPGSPVSDVRDVPHGAVSEVTYYSSVLKRHRRLHVYTPPGYETGTDSYPVFYLLHGAFDSDDSWTTVGRAGVILDNLIADGKAKPMVVVMPHGHTGPFTFGRPFSGEFEQEFVDDIMPLVQKRYRLLDGRENRAMAGLSMGGAQTLNIGIPHLDRFGWLGVFSSGVFEPGGPGGQNRGPQFEERHAAVLGNAELKEGLKLFWFATGRDDFLLRTTQTTVGMFRKHGFNVVYEETDGGHTWDKWRDYLAAFAPQLFR